MRSLRRMRGLLIGGITATAILTSAVPAFAQETQAEENVQADTLEYRDYRVVFKFIDQNDEPVPGAGLKLFSEKAQDGAYITDKEVPVSTSDASGLSEATVNTEHSYRISGVEIPSGYKLPELKIFDGENVIYEWTGSFGFHSAPADKAIITGGPVVNAIEKGLTDMTDNNIADDGKVEIFLKLEKEESSQDTGETQDYKDSYPYMIEDKNGNTFPDGEIFDTLMPSIRNTDTDEFIVEAKDSYKPGNYELELESLPDKFVDPGIIKYTVDESGNVRITDSGNGVTQVVNNKIFISLREKEINDYGKASHPVKINAEIIDWKAGKAESVGNDATIIISRLPFVKEDAYESFTDVNVTKREVGRFATVDGSISQVLTEGVYRIEGEYKDGNSPVYTRSCYIVVKGNGKIDRIDYGNNTETKTDLSEITLDFMYSTIDFGLSFKNEGGDDLTQDTVIEIFKKEGDELIKVENSAIKTIEEVQGYLFTGLLENSTYVIKCVSVPEGYEKFDDVTIETRDSTITDRNYIIITDKKGTDISEPDKTVHYGKVYDVILKKKADVSGTTGDTGKAVNQTDSSNVKAGTGAVVRNNASPGTGSVSKVNAAGTGDKAPTAVFAGTGIVAAALAGIIAALKLRKRADR